MTIAFDLSYDPRDSHFLNVSFGHWSLFRPTQLGMIMAGENIGAVGCWDME